MNTKLTQSQPGDEINITHYVNPQLFWYYKSDSLLECAQKFRKLEKELQRYLQPGLSNQDYEGNAKIILDYQPLGKLIRAQILHVLRRNPDNLDADCTYVVWAMDYGFPIETTKCYMSPLPEQLGGSLLHIQRGGVGFVLPAAQHGRSVNDRLQRQQNLNWHAYACNNFESKLRTAKLRFDTAFQTRSGQNFGYLYIYVNGDVVTAAEYLINQKFGKACESNFSEICMQLPATKLCSWLTIEGKSNMEMNCKQTRERARCRDITQKVEITVGLANAQEILQNLQVQKMLEETPKQQKTNTVKRIVNETYFDNGFLNEPDNFQKLVHKEQQYPIQNGHTRFRRLISNLTNPAQKTDTLDAILQRYDEFSLSKEDKESNKLSEKDGVKPLRSRKLSKLDQLLHKRTEVIKSAPSTTDEQLIEDQSSNVDTTIQENIPNFSSSSNKNALRGIMKKQKKPTTIICEKLDNVDCETPPKNVNKLVESNIEGVEKLSISKLSASATNEKPASATQKKLANSKPNTVPKLLLVYKKPSVNQMPENQTDPAQQLDKLDQILREEALQLKPVNGPMVKTKKLKQQTNNDVTRVLTEPQNNLSAAEKLNTRDIIATQTFFCDHLVVAHTNVPLKPIAHTADADFANSVLKKMHQTDFKEIYRTQCFAWPHILAGNSMILINGPKSGRTWSYLPALCSNIFYRIEMSLNNSELWNNGPMAIVLVASTNQVQYVATSCENLLAATTSKMTRVVAAFAGQNNNDVRIQLHNGCGILVVTPPQLSLLLKQNELEQMIVPDVLQHIVIDDIDLVHAHNPAECKSLIVKLLNLCRMNKARLWEPQLVMISNYWDAQYMSAIVQRARAPLLLFGDFLEAAAYAHVNLNIKHIKSADKMRRLLDFLESRKISDRTVIFCKDDSEILRVQRELERENYKCLTYMGNADITTRESIKFWKHEILICTDGFWQDLEIQDTHYLIHYALSNSWSKFTRRFSTIAQHFQNALTTNLQNERKENQLPKGIMPRVLILLDESNHLEIPRFKDFMDKHKIKVHPLIMAIAKQSRRKREELRVNNGYTVCRDLATYGNCDEFGCIYRHTLTCNDAVPLERHKEIPEQGVVCVQLLKVYEPNHFAVRILKHRALDTQDWVTLSNQTNFVRLGFKLNMHFADPENYRVHWPQAVQDICVLKVGTTFQRVRILDVPEYQKNIDPLNVHLQIQILDVNTDILSRKAGDLLACPMEFRLLPPLAIDMRLLGVVPYSGERVWLPSVTKLIEHELQPNNSAKNEQVLGLIDFSLVHTIFIKNLIVLEHLETLGTDTYKVNLKQFLVDKEFAKADKDIVFKLHDMFADVLKENREKIDASTTRIIEDDTDSNDSFKSMVSDWDDEYNDNVAKLDHLQCSAEALSYVEKNKCADDATVIGEAWCDLPLNKPTKINIYHAKENGNWSGFYVRDSNAVHQRSFDEMQRRIENYMHEKQPACVTSLKNFKHGDNFILKHNDEFLRAKLLTTSTCSELSVNTCQFLIVDFGFTLNIETNEFDESLLYESTSEINEALPYQAIHCKLTGIALHASAKHLQIEGKHLYAVAKRECDNPVKNTQMHAYEILLYECDIEDDLENGIIFNKRLVDIGVADYDENSQMDLSEDVGKSKAMEPIDSLKEFKQCMDTILDLEEDERLMAELFLKSFFQKDDDGKNEPKAKKKSVIATVEVRSIDEATKESNNSTGKSKRALPNLVSASKRPQVSWYQSSAFIHLSIEAAEVTEYVVSCDGTRLFYTTVSPHDTIEEFNILLRGLVVHVAHEKRGLNVIVKLQKVCCGFWPSLLQTKLYNVENENELGEVKALLYKLPWLKYNLEHAKTSSQALSFVQEKLLLQSRQDAGLHITHFDDENSDSMSGDESYEHKCDNEGDVGADEDLEVESKEYPVY